MRNTIIGIYTVYSVYSTKQCENHTVIHYVDEYNEESKRSASADLVNTVTVFIAEFLECLLQSRPHSGTALVSVEPCHTEGQS